jgi:NAD(P)-dependent dehydrogenase (short-subunit alcohol dehydrogenase family)
MAEFDNRVVVVTGASGNLGRAVARAFGDAGAKVAPFSGFDLTDRARTAAAIQDVIQAHGRLDVLVNIAGGFRWEKLEGGSIATWDAMYARNLKTAVVTTSAALPHLLASAPGSRIINVAAAAAVKTAAAGMGAYTASKAGVIKLTESLADELRGRGVTVNAILPGTIDTPQNRADMPKADRSHWVQPESIAQVILFLASARAADVTGAALPVGCASSIDHDAISPGLLRLVQRLVRASHHALDTRFVLLKFRHADADRERDRPAGDFRGRRHHDLAQAGRELHRSRQPR